MNVSRRNFLGGATAAFFIGGCCNSKFGGRFTGAHAAAAEALQEVQYCNGWELGA